MATTPYTVKEGDKFSPFTGKAITAPAGTVIYGDIDAKKDYGTSNTPPTSGFTTEQPSYTVKEGDKFNPYTGKPLESTTAGTLVYNPLSTPSNKEVAPEDKQLLDMGITTDELAKLNSPEGLDPLSFQSLIDKVETKLKTNNELVTQRGYLIKHLFDSPLTKDELKALPEDIQKIVKTGDKDTIQLQLRLLNDQIAGRGNTLSQSIGYLVKGYETAAQIAEEEKQNAIDNVVNFVNEYGSKAPSVLKNLYGAEYLDKLKTMGIDINAMAATSTLSEIESKKSGSGVSTTPLSILDVQRYNELFPDAGVVAGDTEAEANAKVKASNSPEAQVRNLIVAAKENGNDYKTVIKEIENDDTIEDKETAKSIAREIYGITDTSETAVKKDKYAPVGDYISAPTGNETTAKPGLISLIYNALFR